MQQYYCKLCNKYQRSAYSKSLVTDDQQTMLVQLNNEGCGIRSIARLLKMPAATVVRYIKQLSLEIERPEINEKGEIYEIDELQTYIGRNTPSNYIWIAYAINRRTRRVIDFIIGRRTKENLKILTDKISSLQPKYIYTDGLNSYRNLINKAIHKVQAYKINYIERNNLTLRTHLKRLSRKTICFSKSVAMLQACLLIYFFS